MVRVKSQLKRLARPMYSNPPVHGARIVANVVGDPTLFGEWKKENGSHVRRIKNVRQRLFDNLSSKTKAERIGLSFSNRLACSPHWLEQGTEDNMTNKWHVYDQGWKNISGWAVLSKCAEPKAGFCTTQLKEAAKAGNENQGKDDGGFLKDMALPSRASVGSAELPQDVFRQLVFFLCLNTVSYK
ncbi:hypothetical protein HPP92_017934 [Vanilla planifolia]|uniref:Aminotransferase class I/classII large domain-containing protein n=1 Tax=Vanilla planifolia TaxID=51239 RepID=A0A835Q8V5_VANPL|nr:hypothetical protein HPP92_017934 [Vanilla planifolia]